MNNDANNQSATIKESDISSELQQLVQRYIDKSSIRSVAFLSRKAQLPYTTVRRVACGEGNPDFETVIAILNVIVDKEIIMKFISKYFPDHYKILDGTFSTTMNESSDDYDHYPYDEISNHILHLCSTSIGSNIDTITSLFGANGIKKLDNLIKNGLIERNQQRLIVTSDHDLPVEKSLRNFEIFARIFDVENLGTNAALLCLVSEKTNQLGLVKIKQASEDYLKKARQVQKKNKGVIPFYLGLMHNLYQFQPNKQSDFNGSNLQKNKL